MSEDVEAWDEKFGAAAYNKTWELLETEPRSADEDAEMLASAFAQRYHWFRAGEDHQKAVAEWQVSRAFAALGRGDLAVTFAERARELAESCDGPDYLESSVYEGLARAHAANGNQNERDAWLEKARGALSNILEREDRAVIEGQIASVPSAP